MVVVIIPSLRSGGTEWQTYALLSRLCQERAAVLWVYDSARRDPRVTNAFEAIPKLRVYFGWSYATLRKIVGLQPRCILSYAINFYIPELLLKLLTGAGLITERRNLYHWLETDPRRRFQERLRNCLTKTVICNSRAVEERVRALEPEVARKTVVISNCVLPRDVQIDHDRNFMVAVANIKKGKGLEDVAANFAQLASELPREQGGAQFAIFGRLDDPSVFSKLSEQDIRSIYQGERESAQIFSVAFCICHLSRSEGFPNAVLEAISAGVVPILSDIPVHRELFGDCALFVADRKEAMLAMKQVIEMRAARPADLHAWSEQCRRVARRYSPEERAARYREILDARCA